jgi:diacylglycerol kinase (ATP)
MKPRARGITDLARVWRAVGYSLAGLRAAWREPAFRQEVVLFALLAPLGLWLGANALERILLVLSLVLVLVVELVNSAIEAAVDRMGRRPHALAGRAKDMASAAVLLAILNVLFVWGSILAARFFD